MRVVCYEYSIYAGQVLLGIVEAVSLDDAREEVERMFNKSAVFFRIVLNNK